MQLAKSVKRLNNSFHLELPVTPFEFGRVNILAISLRAYQKSLKGTEWKICMIDINEVEIINNPDESRFEAHVEGHLAVLDYQQDDEKITYIHTGVPAEIEAQGIGTKLAKTGLDYARDNGLDVIPLCPFVVAYIRAHPEYQSLVRHGSDI